MNESIQTASGTTFVSRKLRMAISAAVGAGVLLIAFVFHRQQETLHRDESRDLAAAELATLQTHVEGLINRRLRLVEGLVAFRRSREEFTMQEFLDFAYALEGDKKGIRSLQFAPDGIVTYVSHPEKNAAAIGHNLLGDLERIEVARRSIRERRYIIAGPLELVQGGRAVIARYPIFVPADDGDEQFWGFATIILDFDQLVEEMDIPRFTGDCRVAFRGKNGAGPEGEFFLGDESVFAEDPVFATVNLAAGSWQIAGVPKNDWPRGWPHSGYFWIVSIIFALLASAAVHVMLRRPEDLQRAVDEATQALRESEEKLLRSQRLDAMGQLTGGVAHDFNNLLQVILGSVDFLEDLEGEPAEYVDEIHRAAVRGAELTHRLLAYSRRQSLKTSSVDLASLAAGMTDLLSRTLGENISIETSTEGGLWRAEADAGQVEDALLNLAINSRDAMPAGGKLSIACRNARIDQVAQGEVEITPGDYVVLAVSDTGEGISEEHRSRIFEPFFTTKDVGKGSGLGLSMIYGFAAQSGGGIRLQSDPGKGTTVELFLPRDVSQLEPTEATRIEPVALGSGERVLVIEDEPAVRSLTVKSLTRLGYRPTGAGDVADAKRHLDAGETFDLVLSDVILPGGVSGLQLAAELAERHPGLPVVLMSGYPAEELERQGISRGDMILLQKPVRRNELAMTLRQVLDRSV